MKDILIIENNQMIAELTARMINSNQNYQIQSRVAYDLTSGIKEIQNKVPDVVILDCHLNDRSQSTEEAIAIVNQLKSLDQKVPVILFTGSESKLRVIELMQLGAIDCVSKNSESFLGDLIASVNNTFDLLTNNKELISLRAERFKAISRGSILIGVFLVLLSIVFTQV